ncbi:hypothetical protein D3C72_1913410 [compost metagenome]
MPPKLPMFISPPGKYLAHILCHSVKFLVTSWALKTNLRALKTGTSFASVARETLFYTEKVYEVPIDHLCEHVGVIVIFCG